MTIKPENELDYRAFCVSLYDIMKPALSMNLDVFMKLPEVERAYLSGKSAEQLAHDAMRLTQHRIEQAKKQVEKKSNKKP